MCEEIRLEADQATELDRCPIRHRQFVDDRQADRIAEGRRCETQKGRGRGSRRRASSGVGSQLV